MKNKKQDKPDYKIMKLGKVNCGYGGDGIALNNIFSVEKTEDGTFCVLEECDGWHSVYLDKEELLLMIEELKNWVEQQ